MVVESGWGQLQFVLRELVRYRLSVGILNSLVENVKLQFRLFEVILKTLQLIGPILKLRTKWSVVNMYYKKITDS
jgi:hypothetical protein